MCPFIVNFYALNIFNKIYIANIQAQLTPQLHTC